MVTDAFLIRRLAFEIAHLLRGAKVQEVGLLADGRIAVVLWNRGVARALCLDVFTSPPMVTVEPEEPGVAVEPGFVRALGAALRGTALTDVRARRGDRVLRFTFASRNRFGVGDDLELLVELVPRFGNAVLLKNQTIVAALKEFSLADNPSRSVLAGQPYAPPPPRAGDPLPKLVARGRDPARCETARAFLESDRSLRTQTYVYRREDRIEQVHLLPLAGFDADSVSRGDLLLEAFAEYSRSGVAARDDGSGKRRLAIERLLTKREERLRAEIVALDERRTAAGSRDVLRAQGDAIYARLHEIASATDRAESKREAAALFARYKKLGASLPHLDVRERRLQTELTAIETLRWEAERAHGSDFDDVERAIGALSARPTRHRGKTGRRVDARKRSPLAFDAPDGSRVMVGRSPSENADLTFRVAKPEDLWFHARGTPGAHVILKRDDRNAPSSRDVEFAASLAAAHSKAAAAGKVPVDYTYRKHVRKQPDAPPGLVWYTHAKTATVVPYGDET